MHNVVVVGFKSLVINHITPSKIDLPFNEQQSLLLPMITITKL